MFKSNFAKRLVALSCVASVMGLSGLGWSDVVETVSYNTGDNATFQLNVTKTNQMNQELQDANHRQSTSRSFGSHAVVIDTMPRTLGGAYVPSGPNKQLPTQKFPFSAPSMGGGSPTLHIGALYGINTPEAHAQGTSTANHVSSPVVIKVNGKRVQYVYTNGENIKVKLPAYAINPNGFNVVQIEAGYYYPQENEIAYDEIHLQHLALDF